MSGGPKRNQDKINTIGVVVIGICAAVLVYVSIVGLQAFYTNDSSDVQTMADYGGQDTANKVLRADQQRNINETHSNPGKPTYSISIKDAMKLVLRDANDQTKGPAMLVPAIGKSETPTIQSIFGRPKPLVAPGAGSGSATPPPADVPAMPPATPTGGAGAGSNG